MQNMTQAYAKNAQATGSPRELEAQLLLRAAAKLQAIKDGTPTEPQGLISAIRYNRRLWLVFANLANFIVNHSMKLETDRVRTPDGLGVLININREIAAGLRAQAA